MRTPNGPKSSGSAHSILPCARDAKSLHEERLLIFSGLLRIGRDGKALLHSKRPARQ